MLRRATVEKDPLDVSALARSLVAGRCGAVRVTCSVAPLRAIARYHEDALASCELVERDRPRLVTCGDAREGERESEATGTPRASSEDAREGDREGSSGKEKKEEDVPLYARRKWKAPSRLDVKIGAQLGDIEAV